MAPDAGVPELLRLDRVEPASGPTSGGTELRLLGAAMRHVERVQVEDQNCPINTTDDREVVCTLPAQARAGRARIVLFDRGGGQAQRTDLFAYHYADLRFTPTPVLTTARSWTQLASRDLDMDGDLDLIVASNDSGSHFTALIGDKGKGTFTSVSYPSTSQPSRQIHGLTTAHIEGMGRFPAVVLAVNSTAMTYLSSGRAFGIETLDTAISSLSLRTMTDCGSRGCRIAAIQLQQDAFERILVYENTSPAALNLHQYVTGSGFVDRPIFVNLSYQAQEIFVSDLNGDRSPDIAISGSDGFVHIYFGNSDPTFTVGPTLGPFPGGVQPAKLHGADYDGDGLVDLAVAGSGSPRIVRYFGRGGGLFSDGEEVNLGDVKLRLQAGDINGDGVSDLLFLDAVATPSDGKFRALLSTGTRQQSANLLFLAPGDHRALFVGDMNGDRLADVVMADVAGRVQSFINTSGATPR